MFRGAHRPQQSIQELLVRLARVRTVSTAARRVGTLHRVERVDRIERGRSVGDGASAALTWRRAICNLRTCEFIGSAAADGRCISVVRPSTGAPAQDEVTVVMAQRSLEC